MIAAALIVAGLLLLIFAPSVLVWLGVAVLALVCAVAVLWFISWALGGLLSDVFDIVRLVRGSPGDPSLPARDTLKAMAIIAGPLMAAVLLRLAFPALEGVIWLALLPAYSAVVIWLYRSFRKV